MKHNTNPMSALPSARALQSAPYVPRRNTPSPLSIAAHNLKLKDAGLVPLPPLSPTQIAVLRFVDSYRRQHFVGPTTEEIARAIYRCKSNTARYIHILLARGLLCAAYLDRDPARVRIGSLHVPADVLARLPKE